MEEDHTRAVQIATWFTVIASIIVVIARVITKARVVRSITLDDYLISAALLFAIGQTVAVSTQTYHGYGKPLKASGQADLETDLKSGFVAALLYILALCLAKVTVLALIRTAIPIRKERRDVYAAAIIICLLAFVEELAVAFGCDMPRPWDYIEGKCINLFSWWTFFETMNILTDTALILLPFVCLFRRQASLAKEAWAFSFFAFRIMAIVAAICKLVYLSETLKARDPILHTWPVVVCTQTIQCLSIVSACFPCLKQPCGEEAGSIESGLMRRKASSQSDIHGSDFSRAMGLRNITRGRHAASAVADTRSQDAKNLRDQGYMSQAYMIKETKTFAVEQEALACRYC